MNIRFFPNLHWLEAHCSQKLLLMIIDYSESRDLMRLARMMGMTDKIAHFWRIYREFTTATYVCFEKKCSDNVAYHFTYKFDSLLHL